MKIIVKFILIFVACGLLTSCGIGPPQKEVAGFDQETKQKIEEKAQEFSNEEYQNGEVPLKTDIKMVGEIIQTDGKDPALVRKNDRFILKNEDCNYQVFNSTDQTFEVGERVTVYGEYHGFIQSRLIIESEQSSNE